jgi:hypothetical protein
MAKKERIITESQLNEIMSEMILEGINEGRTDEWFDGIRMIGRGIKNRWDNAVQTGKGVVNAVRNGEGLNGVASELGKGALRGIQHRADNIGHAVGDVAQNYRDVWNGTKKAVGAVGSGLASGWNKGINRNNPQGAQQGALAGAVKNAASKAAGAAQQAAQQQKAAKSAPNPKIMQLQKALIAAGYNPGPADGLMGPKTMAAAKQAGVNVNTWQPGTAINGGPGAVAAQKPVQGLAVAQPKVPQPVQVAESKLIDMISVAILEETK